MPPIVSLAKFGCNIPLICVVVLIAFLRHFSLLILQINYFFPILEFLHPTPPTHILETNKQTKKNNCKNNHICVCLEQTALHSMNRFLFKSHFFINRLQSKSIRNYICWHSVCVCCSFLSHFIHLNKVLFHFHMCSYVLSELSHDDKITNVSVLFDENSPWNSFSNCNQLNIAQIFIFQLPKNDALAGLCNAIVEAWNIQSNPNAVVLFVIEDVTYNICDQVRLWYLHICIASCESWVCFCGLFFACGLWIAALAVHNRYVRNGPENIL